MDPPYEFGDQGIYELIDLIIKNNFASKGSVLVIERSSKSPAIKWPMPFKELRVKEYGVATLYYAEMG